MIVIGEFNNKYLLVVDEDDFFSTMVKDIAIRMQIGTVKLYHELEKLGGIRKGSTMLFESKSNAEIALQYVNNIALMNKLAGTKRPAY